MINIVLFEIIQEYKRNTIRPHTQVGKNEIINDVFTRQHIHVLVLKLIITRAPPNGAMYPAAKRAWCLSIKYMKAHMETSTLWSVILWNPNLRFLRLLVCPLGVLKRMGVTTGYGGVPKYMKFRMLSIHLTYMKGPCWFATWYQTIKWKQKIYF